MKQNFTMLKRITKLFSLIISMISMMLSSIAANAADPEVIAVSPADQASGVSITTKVVVTFNVNMNASTINSSSFELRTNGNNVVAATISYDATLRKATLTPLSALEYLTSYKVRVEGGNVGVLNVTGDKMKNDFQSSFTT